ncbi:Uric acid degradation bifunctional protein [Planctomycetes bacterium MalM25]|nr:Uric acid degradation bifunctional protein [Planctomycetes bacterium MalM25]
MNGATTVWLNGLDTEQAEVALLRCCGSRWWAARVAADRPYADTEALAVATERAFDAMPDDAWLEAIRSHPKIGDFESLKMKYAGNREWSGGEQAGAAAADEETLRRLAAGNDAYQRRFGYLFVVCATGKSAAQMLALLEERLNNEVGAELRLASDEQRKITRLRLAKLRPSTDPS